MPKIVPDSLEFLPNLYLVTKCHLAKTLETPGQIDPKKVQKQFCFRFLWVQFLGNSFLDWFDHVYFLQKRVGCVPAVRFFLSWLLQIFCSLYKKVPLCWNHVCFHNVLYPIICLALPCLIIFSNGSSCIALDVIFELNLVIRKYKSEGMQQKWVREFSWTARWNYVFPDCASSLSFWKFNSYF